MRITLDEKGSRLVTLDSTLAQHMHVGRANGPGYCVRERPSNHIVWFCPTFEKGAAYIERVRRGLVKVWKSI